MSLATIFRIWFRAKGSTDSVTCRGGALLGSRRGVTDDCALNRSRRAPRACPHHGLTGAPAPVQLLLPLIAQPLRQHGRGVRPPAGRWCHRCAARQHGAGQPAPRSDEVACVEVLDGSSPAPASAAPPACSSPSQALLLTRSTGLEPVEGALSLPPQVPAGGERGLRYDRQDDRSLSGRTWRSGRPLLPARQ